MARRSKDDMWKERLSKAFEFPADVILDIPRITIEGNNRLIIENHGGIIEYSMERIRIRIRHGESLIQGKRLIIATILKDQIEINGEITKVEFLA